MNRCMRYLVSGHVQGVYYRGATQLVARRLHLCGVARNLNDGRVEVIACGEPASLKELERWLWQGPVHARVAGVICEEIEPRAYDDFETR
jgi:acylphosphatase